MALSGLPPDADKRAVVRSMFDRIAPRYDLLNRLLTFGLDRGWRRLALDAVALDARDRVLDVACGTGDLAALAAARGARALGLDFSREMLRGAASRREAPPLVQADAERLPLPDASVSVVTCGFALRNFHCLDRALAEMARVLRDGGRLALVEVDRPESGLLRAGHRLYFEGVVPRVGGLLSDRAAYRYLPRSSVYLPAPAELRRRLEARELVQVQRVSLGLGAAQLVTARRRPRTGG